MSRVSVLVQNEAGSTTKNRHDEVSLQHLGSIEIIEPYPFAYGFIPGTSAADGACLDCYILTDRSLKTGDLIEAVPVGVLEFFENDQPDHKVLCVLPGEREAINPEQEEALRTFVRKVSVQFPEAGFESGLLLDKITAIELVQESKSGATGT